MSHATMLFFVLTGAIILSITLLKAVLHHSRFPDVLFYLFIGLLLNLLNLQFHLIGHELREYFRLLAELGLVVLLFRVGLESDLSSLLRQLKRAIPLWLGNVSLSFLLGFVVSYSLLSWSLTASLFVAVALSATSVGVSLSLWRSAGILHTEDGALLLDIAELDDLSSIFMMALLLGLAPLLQGQDFSLSVLSVQLLQLVGKLLLLVGSCVLFALYMEQPLLRFVRTRTSSLPVTITLMIGVTFIIAGLAKGLGLSFAIGAMFAGLAFSRDPTESELEKGMDVFGGVFIPFFFLGIGLSIQWKGITAALIPGVLLFAAGAAGKIIGTYLPGRFFLRREQALLLGFSMIPRAEIAMIVIQEGQRINHKLIHTTLYSSMVIVVLLSCLLTPLFLPRFLPGKTKNVA